MKKTLLFLGLTLFFYQTRAQYIQGCGTTQGYGVIGTGVMNLINMEYSVAFQGCVESAEPFNGMEDDPPNMLPSSAYAAITEGDNLTLLIKGFFVTNVEDFDYSEEVSVMGTWTVGYKSVQKAGISGGLGPKNSPYSFNLSWEYNSQSSSSGSVNYFINVVY